ncbi:MAG: hypothetical protein AB7V32_06300 [Candidatus Berkiella sp.]
MLTFNAHVHLNGSISAKYLFDAAVRNQCEQFYTGFVNEADLWQKFGWIHKIMQTPEDIRLATLDVVEHSKADILEIRTTPKEMKGHSIDGYIDAFVAGLTEAVNKFPQKRARGLLSIDRSRHTLTDAKQIIDAALEQKQKNGMIVGIDLSGNFNGKRTLTGNELYDAIKYALSLEIGVALHVGEIDSIDEKTDFDLLLKAIQEYGGKIYGKVRFGHAIFRTKEQDEIIGKLKIPVEICPSCHQTLDWWKANEPHPILTLYQHHARVIPGTDNSLLFACDEQNEQQTLDAFMQVPDKDKGLSKEQFAQKISTKRKRYMFS